MVADRRLGQLERAVSEIDLAVRVGSDSKRWGAGPVKVLPGYGIFASAEPPLKLIRMENPGRGRSVNHLGVEVADTEAGDAERARLAAAGMAADEERETTCCYARQDKFWVEGAPNGEMWEGYTVLEDSPTFYGDDTVTPARGGPAAGLPGTAEAATASRCC